MEKSKINTIITIAIIVAVLFFSVYILIKDNTPSQITEELAKCIGENSELYVQTGCSACKIQEDLFGSSIQYLNMTDCFLQGERQICVDKNIEVTPTWIIKGNTYKGVQTIEKLKSLTGC